MERGVVLRRAVEDLAGQPYLLYLPTSQKSRNKALVLVHGRSRQVDTLVGMFQPYAERRGASLVAPVFDSESSANYQQLGFEGHGDGGLLPHDRLRRVLDHVNRFTDISTSRFWLYGHSGGAQFVHRYAMAFPDTVIRYAISSAGWYTLPDMAEAFPYGMKATSKFPGISLDIEKFLRIPVCVLVGENDTRRGAMVNKSERIDRAQGLTRVERARNWVAAMTAAAQERGLDPPAQLRILPGAGHNFSHLEAKGGLGRHAAKFLFKKSVSKV